MKYLKYLMLSTMFTLLLPASGFARTKEQGTMTLAEPAKIGSAELQPGTYKVEWNGSGPTVHVNIMQHKNTVATAVGKLETNDKEVSQDAVVLEPATDKSSTKQIAEIDFARHKEALILSSK